MLNLSNFWRIAGTALALVPGVYGVVFFMVEAKTQGLNQRLEYLEAQANKGDRFTATDGERMRKELNSYIDKHGTEIASLHSHLELYKIETATCKANLANLVSRFNRLEDKVYAQQRENEGKGYMPAPYFPQICPQDKIKTRQ